MPLFRADAPASPLCLGTGSFGTDISNADSFRVLDAFVSAGGTFIDSAHIYAAWREGGWGASERTLGEWMRAHGNRREVVLGTKGGHPPLDRLDVGRCSKECLERDLSESLDRLGVDYVDVYWLHRDDPAREAGEIIETLAGFVKDGRIRSYGASNWTIGRIVGANAHAASHHLPLFAASQIGYSLADRPADRAPVPGMMYMDGATKSWHEGAGMTVAAYTPQAQGFFGESNVRWAEGGFSGEAPKGEGYDTPENRRRLTAAATIAKERGFTTNQIALAYLRHQSFAVYPIIGTGRVERVREAMEAMHVPLAAEEIGLLTSA